jgi:hypothetical protein
MRRLAYLTGALALGLSVGGAASAGVRTSHHAARSACSASYVTAHLSWGVKCLRAGEFCKVGNSQYAKYGFACPPSGHLAKRPTLAAVATTTAPQPVAAPPGATAVCKDGTYSHSQHRSGTCSGHGGVARWLAALPA